MDVANVRPRARPVRFRLQVNPELAALRNDVAFFATPPSNAKSGTYEEFGAEVEVLFSSFDDASPDSEDPLCQILRGLATTTEAVLEQFKNGQGSLRALARRNGINDSMKRTIKEVTVQRYHWDRHDQLEAQLAPFSAIALG
ncbi:hypothetical protein BSZ20_05990 [Bradyrhizobium canariense]|nr:hypothetical protein BSZ20_05990 [Bradyrhizobium canariense]OSI55788.1 hypothetical protein BST67_04595 [Bradyrhizobium canariense]